MDSVYVIVKEAIYYHGVHGVFMDKKKAIEQCDGCRKLDIDNHHQWKVLKIPIGTIPTEKQIQNEGFEDDIYTICGDY